MATWTAARQRERENKRFGWDDLFDLLNTAAGIYTGVQGVREAGKRTDIMGEQQAFNVQKEGMEAAESGRLGTWGEVPENWQGSLTASQREVGGPMGRQQFTQTGTAQDEALRRERVGMLREGWQPDIQGPLSEHYQRGEGYMRNPLADVETARRFAEANPPEYDPSQPFTLVGTEHERTPGFVSDEEKALAAMRAGGGQGAYDPLNAQRLEVMAEQEMMRRYPNAPRGMDGELVYNEAMQAERAQVMEGYKAQFGYAAAGPEDDLSTGATLIEFAQGYAAQNPEAMADFNKADPMTQAVVVLLAQNLPSLGGGQAAPGALPTRAGGVPEDPMAGATEARVTEISQIAALDGEEAKWQAASQALMQEEWTPARDATEDQIRKILSDISAERLRRTLGLRSRRMNIYDMLGQISTAGTP